MGSSGRKGMLLALALLTSGARPVRATDGHFLHGVGAINSALGGAGVGAPTSLLGTYYLNPAGLLAFDGTRSEIGFEVFRPDRTLASNIPGLGAGSTRSTSDWVPLPAIGFSTRLRNDRVAVGIGALGIAGFGVDYLASTTNPILTPQPNGFGQVSSNHQLLKIAPTIAVAVTPRLWLGGGINLDWAILSVPPLPIAAPAVSPGPAAYYSSAAPGDGAFGIGIQAGALYKFNDPVSIGASYTSPQWFRSFRFNSTFANPDLPSYGTPREIAFRLDVPAVYAAGLGLHPLPALTIAADARYIAYDKTRGFKESGFNGDGSVRGFGWKSIWVAALGAQFEAGRRVTLRAGYNPSGNPISGRQAFFNIPAPGIVQDHISFGLGYKVTQRFDISAAYYRGLRNSVSGPIPNPSVPAGSTVTNSLHEDSMLLQFSFGERLEAEGPAAENATRIAATA